MNFPATFGSMDALIPFAILVVVKATILLAIAAGQTASREAFEAAYKSGAVVPRFPWEED